jgi:hypothetical protein
MRGDSGPVSGELVAPNLAECVAAARRRSGSCAVACRRPAAGRRSPAALARPAASRTRHRPRPPPRPTRPRDDRQLRPPARTGGTARLAGPVVRVRHRDHGLGHAVTFEHPLPAGRVDPFVEFRCQRRRTGHAQPQPPQGREPLVDGQAVVHRRHPEEQRRPVAVDRPRHGRGPEPRQQQRGRAGHQGSVPYRGGEADRGCLPRPLPEALDHRPAVQRDYLFGLAGPVHEGRQILPGVPGQPPVFDHAGR